MGGQDAEEVVIVPTGHFSAGFDSTLGFLVLPEQIEGEFSQGGKVLGRMVFANTAPIFVKGHIQDPMQAVFNAPMGMPQWARMAFSRRRSPAHRLLKKK